MSLTGRRGFDDIFVFAPVASAVEHGDEAPADKVLLSIDRRNERLRVRGNFDLCRLITIVADAQMRTFIAGQKRKSPPDSARTRLRHLSAVSSKVKAQRRMTVALSETTALSELPPSLAP